MRNNCRSGGDIIVLPNKPDAGDGLQPHLIRGVNSAGRPRHSIGPPLLCPASATTSQPASPGFRR
jgi:hypothetical protein